MKIKNRELSYAEVMALPQEKHMQPKRPDLFFRTLFKVLGTPDLKATDFSLETEGMEKIGRGEPALFLMNHSSFIDLKIAATVLYPRPFNIWAASRPGNSLRTPRWSVT